MSSSQAVAAAKPSTFTLDVQLTPPQAPQVPAKVEEPPKPPRVPLTTRLKTRVDAFQQTDLGIGVTNWVNTVGAVAGYVVPVAVAAGVGYAIGGVGGSARVAGDSMMVWGIGAAIASVGAQGAAMLGNVQLYKRAGAQFPRLRSFADVMGWLVAPAAVSGWLTAQAYGADVGTWTGAIVGGITASIGLSVYAARCKRRH